MIPVMSVLINLNSTIKAPSTKNSPEMMSCLELTIMQVELPTLLNVRGGDDGGDEAVSRVLEEPLGAVVMEAVVDLVGQSCAIVFQVDQITFNRQ